MKNNEGLHVITSVSQHAVFRYTERSQTKVRKIIENEIIQKAQRGTEVLPRKPAKKLMQPRYHKVKFLKKDDLVFVVGKDGGIITVMNYSQKSFKIK